LARSPSSGEKGVVQTARRSFQMAHVWFSPFISEQNLTYFSDLVHEKHPAGITHLHNDTVPSLGGDTLWASGYAAYSKLSPDFRKIIDGKKAIYVSAHTYLDRNNPEAGPKHIERIHPIVRVHPATGWKSLFVNRSMTKSIVGLDKAESDVILNYLYHVYETNVDIQVRFKWTPRTSALWYVFCSVN
jgi:alpha-ketoglutarate-dependent taurine dioxygenase